jgi:hypothetical protein
VKTDRRKSGRATFSRHGWTRRGALSGNWGHRLSHAAFDPRGYYRQCQRDRSQQMMIKNLMAAMTCAMAINGSWDGRICLADAALGQPYAINV